MQSIREMQRQPGGSRKKGSKAKAEGGLRAKTDAGEQVCVCVRARAGAGSPMQRDTAEARRHTQSLTGADKLTHSA